MATLDLNWLEGNWETQEFELIDELHGTPLNHNELGSFEELVIRLAIENKDLLLTSFVAAANLVWMIKRIVSENIDSRVRMLLEEFCNHPDDEVCHLAIMGLKSAKLSVNNYDAESYIREHMQGYAEGSN